MKVFLSLFVFLAVCRDSFSNPIEDSLRFGLLCPSSNSAFDCPSDCIKHHGQAGGECELVTNYCLCNNFGNSTVDEGKGPGGGALFDFFASNTPSNNLLYYIISGQICTNDCLCLHNRNGGAVNYSIEIDGIPQCFCNPGTSPGCDSGLLSALILSG